MQNIVVLSKIYKHELIPVVKKEHYLQAMGDLMKGDLLKANINLLKMEL